MRILVYGDSNSWGYLDDGLEQRFADRWPVVMAREAEGLGAVLIEECLSGRTTNLRDPEMGDHVDGAAPLMAILRSHTPLDLVRLLYIFALFCTSNGPFFSPCATSPLLFCPVGEVVLFPKPNAG